MAKYTMPYGYAQGGPLHNEALHLSARFARRRLRPVRYTTSGLGVAGQLIGLYMYFRQFAPMIAATLLVGCQASVRGEHDTAPAARVIQGFLLKDGVLVVQGQDTTRVSIAIEEAPDGLVVREVAPRSTLAPTDTLDAAGLYVHSAHAYDRSEPRVGSPPLYTVRTGLSPGSPAAIVLSLSGPPFWRSIELKDNYPPGPIDPAVGCYEVIRGPWRESIAVSQWRGPPVPPDLRLHWQYKWHYGAEDVLVATDARGNVPGEGTHFFSWRRAPDGETVRIGFTAWYQTAVVFRVAHSADQLVGTIRLVADTVEFASADVRLRPVACQHS